jgi:hypothetical protein
LIKKLKGNEEEGGERREERAACDFLPIYLNLFGFFPEFIKENIREMYL